MKEQLALETVLYGVLDAQINDMPFYSGVAPEGAQKPFILAQFISSNDITCQWSTKMGVEMMYRIEVFKEGESFPFSESESVDELISGYSGVSNDCTVDIARDHVVSLHDSFDGHEIRRSGAVYKIIVRRN